MTTLPSLSRVLDGDGDVDMAHAPAEASGDWRARRLRANLSPNERQTLEAHIASVGGRSYIEEKRWIGPPAQACPQLHLPPITPGNPYFFHEQARARGARPPSPRREALPSFSSLAFDWDTEVAEEFVNQRRRESGPPPPEQRAREHLQEARQPNVHVGGAVRDARPPPSTRPKECVVCFEQHQPGELVILHHCQCAYCLPCLNQAFRVACKDRASFPPKCHNVPLRISALGSVLDDDVVERYKQIEAEFSAHRPFYCALPTCSAFIPETDHLPQQEVAVCPQCHNSTCKHCQRLQSDHPVWHADVHERKCPDPEEDFTKLLELGDEKEWRQCPTCGNMVEKTEGCEHMDCVCGVEFCYMCGTLFDERSRCGCYDEYDEHDDDDDDDDDDEEPYVLRNAHWPNILFFRANFVLPGCVHDIPRYMGTVRGGCDKCSRHVGVIVCVQCDTQLCVECLDPLRQIIMR